MVSLTSMTCAWAPQDYYCSTVLAPLVISAHAQSSKVQTNSFCVWMQLKTTYFQTFLELLMLFPFSTCCSRLWPKEVGCRFCPSFCVMSAFHGKFHLQLSPDATQPMGFVPSPHVSLQSHCWRSTAHVNQQSHMVVFGLGKHCQSGRNCLQFTLQK